MEIILTTDVKGVGRKGNIYTVKSGYARNYLIPKGDAIVANRSNRKTAEQNKLQAAHKALKIKEVAQELCKKIADKVYSFKAKSGGDSGKIFGSVTALQIAQLISTEEKIVLDSSSVKLGKQIKDLGKHTIKVELHDEVECDITISVEKEP